MENITVVKQLNKYNRERYYFSIDRNYLAGLRKYIINDYRAQGISKLLSESDEDRINIEVDFLESVLAAILLQSDFNCDSEFFNSQAGIYLEQYTLARKNYIEYRGEVKNDDSDDFRRKSLVDKLIYDALDGDTSEIEAIISGSKEIIDVSKKIYKMRDLVSAREQVLDSLSTIVSPREVMDYRSQYTKLLNEQPLDLKKIEDYLKELQQLILADWKNKVSSLTEYKPGDKFRFICHSTNSESINGAFYSSLISCSLLTEEFTDTYRSGYGFIFPPNNIVGADGSDMYVHNYTDDEESMLHSTSVPRITSMGKVLEICRNTREENVREGRKEKVYSEIVIRGFEPIGIFCLTVGDRELNPNYMSAKKLQEQFPHLPIIEIDLTYYKDKRDLMGYRDNLLFNIERNINPSAIKLSSSYYNNYEYFWEKFLELKQHGDYKVTDIIDLYRENSELISIQLDIEKLLSGKYDIEAIRYALMNNRIYGISAILSGNFTAYDLINLRDRLIDVIDNPLLEQSIPGLKDLVTLINKIGITDVYIDEIKSRQPITISSITELLRSSLNNIIQNNQNELTQLSTEKQALELSYAQKEMTLKKQKRYYEIINYSFLYSLASSELHSAEEYLKEEENWKNKNMDNYHQMKKEYDFYQTESDKLSKHKILNFFRLKRIKSKLQLLQDSLSHLEGNINSMTSTIGTIKENISDIKKQFKNKTGVNFDEYNDELARANNEYNMDLEFNLPYTLQSIQRRIDEISARMAEIIDINDQLQAGGVRR